MIYEYHCPKCLGVFDVVKSVHQMNLPENCSLCGTEAERKFVPSRVHFTKTKVEHPEYNPGLGCVVNNSKHRAEVAKAKGLEEVGSEPAEKIHAHYEKAREEKFERSWAEADRGWVGNGDVGA